MTTWSEQTLGELCALRAGIVFKPADQGLEIGDVPFIKVSDMNLSSNAIAIREANNWVNNDYLARVRAKPFPAGTTVFAKIGEALRQNRVRKIVRPTLIDNNMMGAIPNLSVVSPEFLYYRLASFDIASTATGTALPYLTVSTLERQRFRIPPRPLQRRIASILSAYDDLIENNTRRIAILEEMARRIYEEWFVRFRFPGHEGVRMVDSELGLVPNGWAVRSFDEIATFTNGFAFKPEHLGTEGSPIVKIKELKAGVQSDTPRFNGPLPDRYRIKHGDLLFSWSADLDVYIWGDEHGWLNQHLFLVDALGPATPSSYLFHALKTSMPSFRTRSNDATMKHIKRSALSEVKTTVPPLQVAAAFDHAVGPLHELVKVLSRKNRNLRTTRDLLLPKLISGDLDVSGLPEPEALVA